MKQSQRRSILLLADVPYKAANTIRDHVGAFPRYSKHRISIVNPRGSSDLGSVDLGAFDVIVIHYTIPPNLDAYLPPDFREEVRRFSGVKVQFLQDEYRWVDWMTRTIRDLGIDILYSAVPEREVEKVYGGRLDGTRVVPTLTGYVPDGLASARSPRLERRRIEVGYRGRVVPWWLGVLGQEKVEIARGVLARAASHGLVCDIAWNEHDRLYGNRWNRFLMMCRATLVTESGASIVDFDGSVERRTQQFLDEHPEATFAEVHEAILAPFEGNAIINAVSPRVLEAAAARSALVAFPGEYSDVIEPHEHYIPLEKDFSNFDEVVGQIRDLPALEAMVKRAHDHLVRSGRYSYETFVHAFDEVVAEGAKARHDGVRAHRQAPRPRATLRLRLASSRLRLRRAKASLGRAFATARLVATDRDLQQLVVAYFRDADIRRSVHVRRLTKDLLRLGIVRRAHRGALVTRRPFSIEATVDAAAERLILASRPKGKPCRQAPAEVIHDAICSGRLSEIVWNHRAIGRSCRYRLAFPSRYVKVPVGYYGLSGIHEFGALKAIADRAPEVVWRAVLPLSAPARSWRRGRLETLVLTVLPRPARRVVLRWLRKRRRHPGPVVDRRVVQKLVARKLSRRARRVHKRLRPSVVRLRKRLDRMRSAFRKRLRHASWKMGHIWQQIRP